MYTIRGANVASTGSKRLAMTDRNIRSVLERKEYCV
jgi:hypothetical protein